MKKILFVALFAFSIVISAQSKKTTVSKNQNIATAVPTEKLSAQAAAQKNIADLNAFTKLSKETKDVLSELFTTKQTMMENHEQYAMDKKEVSRIITMKMESVISAETMQKIRANKSLFDSLVN